MGTETELKLQTTPEALRQIPALPAVVSLKAGRARTMQLVSRYFDTPDGRLRAAGLVLRVRSAGTRWLQAVKSEGSSATGMGARGEWEEAVEGPELSPTVLMNTPAHKALGGHKGFESGFKELRPLFETDFKRKLILLRFADGSMAELCLDEGKVKSGGRSAPICEIEVELKQGSPDRLFDLAVDLAGAVPVRIGRASKAERGHALSTQFKAAPAKAAAAKLAKAMSPDDALRAIVAASLDQLLRNDAGVLAGRDPEYIHQARVAMRRMRSAFSLMRDEVSIALPAPVAELVAEAARTLGAARDWDVLYHDTLRPLAAFFAADASVKAVLRRAVRLRADRVRAAREFVISPAYVQALLELGRFVSQAAGPEKQPAGVTQTQAGQSLQTVAAQILERCHRKVKKRAKRLELDSLVTAHHAGHDVPYEELHQERIQVKKLRYAAEFFQPLFGARQSRGFIQALSGLQDALGGLNDCTTAEHQLPELAGASSGETAGGEASAVSRGLTPRQAANASSQALALAKVQGWVAANRERHLAAIPTAWQEFREEGRFWKKQLPPPDSTPEGAAAPPDPTTPDAQGS